MRTLGIVDNDPLAAQAIEHVLIQRQAPLKVLWSVTGAADAIDLCSRDSCRPNVVLTDMEMPGMGGFALSEALHRRWSDLVIVGMTAFAVDTARMRDVGMSLIVHKDVPTERLVHRIGAAAHDEDAVTWVDGGVSAANLVLTETERQVLTLFLKGRTVLAVARQLHMSEGTVKTHMNNAYKKLGVHNRSQAIGLCVKKGSSDVGKGSHGIRLFSRKMGNASISSIFSSPAWASSTPCIPPGLLHEDSGAMSTLVPWLVTAIRVVPVCGSAMCAYCRLLCDKRVQCGCFCRTDSKAMGWNISERAMRWRCWLGGEAGGKACVMPGCGSCGNRCRALVRSDGYRSCPRFRCLAFWPRIALRCFAEQWCVNGRVCWYANGWLIARSPIRREQLRMMHTLHDSVANTLSYAVLLCRSEQGGHDERIERLVEQALKALRSDVIVPVASRIDDDGRTMGARHRRVCRILAMAMIAPAWTT